MALAALLLPGVAPGQGTLDARAAWLREHAHALHAIDPATTDVSDLAPLVEALDGVRVLMLGEATRGDGASFLAKTRIVRHLFESHDFDVLAFECGFFDCAHAWQAIRAGKPAREALATALFPLYVEADAFQPLIDLIDRHGQHERPLIVAGFDTQITGAAGERHLVPDLRRLLDRSSVPIDALPGFATLEAVLADLVVDAYAAGTASVPSRRVRRTVLDTLEEIDARLAVAATSDSEVAFWRQQLDSLAVQARAAWQLGVWRPGRVFPPAIHNLRDRQMADNLLWLIRERYPDKKVLVWSLTLHVARDLDRLVTGEADTQARLDVFSLLGEHVRNALGEASYALAFTAAGGANGSPLRPPRQLLVPTPGSFEDLMTRSGLESAFLDLRRLPTGGTFLRRGLIAKPIAYKELLGIWPRHVDGFVFLRAQQPSHIR